MTHGADFHPTLKTLCEQYLLMSEGWGLADPNQSEVLTWLLPNIENASERRKIGLDRQRKCLRRARQFTAALDSPAPNATGKGIFLVAGDAQLTTSKIGIEDGNNDLEVMASAPGDGTVLRSSALLDERVGGVWTPTLRSPIRWQGVTFLFTDHLGMTRDPSFTDNVLYILLEDPRGVH